MDRVSAPAIDPARRHLAVLAFLSVLCVVLVAAPASAESFETMDARFGEGLYDAAAVWTGAEAYIFGGNDGELHDPETDKIWRWNATTDTVDEMDARLPTERDRVAAVWTGEHAYLFGGWGCGSTDPGGLNYCREILRYDPATDQIASMDATLPEGDTVAAVWTGEHAYLFSGQADAVYRYDPDTDELATMDATLDVARDGASAVWTGSRALVFGGSSTASILRYDPGADELTTASTKLPSPRNFTAAVWDGTHAYVLGGGDAEGELVDEIVRYDPVEDTVDVRPIALDTGRGSFPGVFDGEHAYVFGGTHEGGYSDRIRRYDPSNAAPTARLTVEVDDAVVQANASASTDPEGRLDAYRWSWGDGDETTTQVPNATHTYTEPGDHVLELTVVDARGGTSVNRTTVQIDNQPPEARFEASGDHTTVSVDASTSTDPVGSIATYTWDYGDGNTSEGVQDQHTFEAPGEHAIRLTVTDAHGATATTEETVVLENRAPQPAMEITLENRTLVADGTGSSDPEGRLATYTWDLGDGTPPVEGARVEHTYGAPGTYTVHLSVEDADGAEASTGRTITIRNHLPVPRIELRVEDATVIADARGSSDPDGSVVTHRWDWGDGTGTDGWALTKHRYRDPGHYTVRLTVVDDDGAEASLERTVEVGRRSGAADGGGDLASPSGMEVDIDGLYVQVRATGEGLEEATVEWHWGDGSPPTQGRAVTHGYRDPGEYPINLTVDHSDGSRAHHEHVVVVEEPTGDATGIDAGDPGALNATSAGDLTGSNASQGAVLESAEERESPLGLGALVAGVAAAMVLIRRRR